MTRPAIGLAAFLAFALCGCASLRRAAATVAIFDAEISQSLPQGGDFIGVEFVAANLSGRPLKSVTVCAAVQERSEDGGQEDDCGGAFYERRFVLEDVLEAGQEERVFVPFEGLPADCAADDFEMQSLYVESAIYDDGELWERK